jgi:hypothetical protein
MECNQSWANDVCQMSFISYIFGHNFLDTGAANYLRTSPLFPLHVCGTLRVNLCQSDRYVSHPYFFLKLNILRITTANMTFITLFVSVYQRRIFGPNRDKVTESCRILHHNDLDNNYPSSSIIIMIKLSRMIWKGRVACRWEMRNT